MSNSNKALLDLYAGNRKQFARAINRAGGNAELVMDDTWSEILYILATNNITITALYRGENDEPNT